MCQAGRWRLTGECARFNLAWLNTARFKYIRPPPDPHPIRYVLRKGMAAGRAGARRNAGAGLREGGNDNIF